MHEAILTNAFFFLDECFFLMQFMRDVRLHGKTCEMTYEMEERHTDSMVCTLVTKWDSFPVPGGASRGLLSCEVLVLSLFIRMDLRKWVGRWRERLLLQGFR